MRVEEKKLGNTTVVKILETRLGADRAVSFKEVMAGFVKKGARSIVLDMSAVEFIDSTGLGAILSVLKMIGKGGEIVICGTTDTVTSMFKLTRMDRVFAMHAKVDDALAAQAR